MKEGELMCDTVRQWTSLQYIHFNDGRAQYHEIEEKIAGLFLPKGKAERYLGKA